MDPEIIAEVARTIIFDHVALEKGEKESLSKKNADFWGSLFVEDLFPELNSQNRKEPLKIKVKKEATLQDIVPEMRPKMTNKSEEFSVKASRPTLREMYAQRKKEKNDLDVSRSR